MAALFRAIVYATLFIGLLLVFLPARLLEWSGIQAPPALGAAQLLGLLVSAAGAGLAIACILTFALKGKGTPAPFDPPRRLVLVGPYRFVRNPMYLGAGLALLGAAIYFGSLALLGYLVGFLIIAHLFVLGYEEPTLRRLFGSEYEVYRASTPRWLPWRRRVR